MMKKQYGLLCLLMLSGCWNMDGKSNVVTTKSGLKYTVLAAAKPGAAGPKQGQKVSVHYTGWLDDKGQPGNKFDSSVDRGAPFEFNVGIGQVIRGWDEAVSLMHVGDKWRIVLPSELGYGARGAGGKIPGNATLIFDVELLAVK
jgi:peptidylprolyl isomerase